MNIFYLDRNYEAAAQMHVDKHVVKMPLEVAQMACTVVALDHLGIEASDRFITKDELAQMREFAASQRSLSQEERFVPYLPVMPNHPCTIWMRSSYQNYAWAVNYALALEKEYTYRYGKPSLKACDVIRSLPTPYFKWTHFTRPAQAMPDQYKCNDSVEAYRKYYIGDKAYIGSWKRRGAQTWWPKELQEKLYT